MYKKNKTIANFIVVMGSIKFFPPFSPFISEARVGVLWVWLFTFSPFSVQTLLFQTVRMSLAAIKAAVEAAVFFWFAVFL